MTGCILRQAKIRAFFKSYRGFSEILETGGCMSSQNLQCPAGETSTHLKQRQLLSLFRTALKNKKTWLKPPRIPPKLKRCPFGDTLDIFPVPDNCWLNGRCSAPLGFAIAGTSECFFLVRWLVADARMWSPSPVGRIGLLNELVVRRVLNGIDSKVHMYW